ncbi:MAG: mobile mystery protein B [Acidobacteria bacterium]|nr:mobile mystery protein B [Acidobacteriota bacterium]
MSPFPIDYPPGATPLDPNEAEGLISDYITTQGELNTLERENITEATNWAESRQPSDILTATFTLNVHKRMLNRVWKWAGKPRRSNKNIGVFKENISTELANLLADTKYWIEHGTYGWDEIGARFHHRLVSIHVFVNGNGRHARIMTNILLSSNRQEPCSWGMRTHTGALEVGGALRDEYISALKRADQGDYDALIRFVRS